MFRTHTCGELRAENAGEKVRLQVVQAERSWLKRRLGLTSAPELPGLQANWAQSLLWAAEERLTWSRFGL